MDVIAAQYSNETADWWEDFEDEFEQLYPRVDVVVDVVSWNDIYTVVNLRIAAGEAPATWTELEKAAKAIKDKYPGVYPIGLDMTTRDLRNTFSCFFLRSGGGFTDSRGNWILNCQENVQTITFLTDLVQSSLTNPDPTTQTRIDLQDLFISQDLAMVIAPDTFASTCDSYGVSYGIAPIPAAAGKQSSSPAEMIQYMCFDNGYTESELAAVTCFFDFFYEEQRYAE